MPTAKKKLVLYNKKRDFTKTREPKGHIGKSRTKQTIFVVQKHAATRLHWDFRLEMEGVLKSWAVTNEPVADPSVKRLAVRTEDHPLSYAGFSGDIPKGQYGGGHVGIWDTGFWQPVEENPVKALQKGKISFYLTGKRMQGRWSLVRMRSEGKRENWLLIKANDDKVQALAHEKAPPLEPVKALRKKASISFEPALALRVDQPPLGNDWLHEVKYDGYRTLLYINKGKACLITRGGLDWTSRFPEIVQEAEKLKLPAASVDGEIVVFRENGTTDFGLLQQVLSGEVQKPMVFAAFDLLSFKGKDYKKLPLIERKEVLENILKKRSSNTIIYSDHVVGKGKTFFQQAKRMKLEGIISKKIDSPYNAGRSGDWLKIKIEQIDEFVIGGILRRSDNPKRVGAVLLGYFKDGDFIYVGKSGTGFPEKLSNEILRRAKSLRLTHSPFTAGPQPKDKKVEWLKPELVGVIHYTEKTKDGQIRHGAFKGLREDKPAAQVHLEDVQSVENSSSPDKKNKFSGIEITHPDRIVFPEVGLTKRDVAAYYDAMADYILPYLKKRPISLIRCPDGLSEKCFIQRHIEGKSAEHLSVLPIKDEESGESYFSIDTKKALLSMAQFGVLEFHPWGSKMPHPDKPDRIIFDLDPDPKIDWPSVKEAAFLIRKRLKALKLESFAKTSGGKGIHIVIPIFPQYSWEQAKSFSREFANALETDFPDAFTTSSTKKERQGKIYVDYLRNDYGNTAVAPFSLRARENASVSMPLDWKDLKSTKSSMDHTLSHLLKTKKIKDPWKNLFKLKQKLPKNMLSAE